MPGKKTGGGDSDRLERLAQEVLRERERREQGYREKALKIYPWICARCGREFAGKKLRELTVHHKDHNHDHNPPDGSNWELLCIYCHDQEHSKFLEEEWHEDRPGGEGRPTAGHKPFAALANLLKNKT